jgi:Mg-chelatase subunit ChlD
VKVDARRVKIAFKFNKQTNKMTTVFTGTCFKCGGVGHSKARCPSAAQIKCRDCGAAVLNLQQHRSTVCPSSRLAKSRVVVAHAAHAAPAAQQQQQPLGTRAAAAAAAAVDHYALIDVSSSMQGDKLNAAKDALLLDIEPAMNAHDRLAIITFDTAPYFKLKPRAVRQLRATRELRPLLARVFAQGNTAIWDAIHLAVSQIHDPLHHATRLHVLTDGEDNASKHTYAEVRALVAATPNVLLNIVHVGTSPNVQYADICAAAPLGGAYRVVREHEVRVAVTVSFALQ